LELVSRRVVFYRVTYWFGCVSGLELTKEGEKEIVMRLNRVVVCGVLGLASLGSYGDITNVTATVTAPAVNPPAQNFRPPQFGRRAELNVLQVVNAPGGVSGGEPGVAWWDIDIVVTRPIGDNGSDLLDLKHLRVTNNTGIDWKDFHVTIGQKTAAGVFVPSPVNSGLFFRNTPAPVNTANGGAGDVQAFDAAPEQDTAGAPDQLWWDGGPGLNNGQTTGFRLRVHLPTDTTPNFAWTQNAAAGTETIAFSIRQHATVPAPGSMALLGIGGLVAGRRRR
jgi:hypothetical protein